VSKEYINPKELFPSVQYGFSQIVTSQGQGKMVFWSGQVGWNEQQEIVGRDDLRAQTWQAFRNIETAIKAVGGILTDIVSMRIYIVEEKLEESHHIKEALKEFFPRKRRLPRTGSECELWQTKNF
jgi:2-iminobutanoate/2-iminopropanoate deaminase